MKEIIGIILVLITMSVKAQQLSPLLVSGSGWRYTGWILDFNFPYIEDVYTFTFNGDSVLDSKVYHKYYFSLVRHLGYDPGVTIINSAYNGCLRSEGEKVYYLAKDSLTELLLYDFSLTIGDTVPQGLYPENINYIITDTSTIQMEDGSFRKKYILNNWNPHFIIYGIGYQTGFLPPSTFIVNTYDGGTGFITYCENGVRVYHNPNGGGFGHADNCDFPVAIAVTDKCISARVYPNPCSTGKLFITTDREPNKQVKLVSLLNQLGVTIKEFYCTEGIRNELDVSEIIPGCYLLKILFQDHSITYIHVIIQ